MKSVDTNILARYVLQDDPVQAELAARTLAGPCFVSNTVLLETAWLLRSRYRMTRADIAATLADILALPRLSADNLALVQWAIARFAAGADFADMMHVAASRGADCFIGFDTKLARLAGPDAPIPIETLA